jgi:biotin carboxylase
LATLLKYMQLKKVRVMSKTESKIIAILGGGVMQLPTLRSAKQMSWTVILCDGDRKALGRKYADYFECIDLKEKEQITEVLCSYKKKYGLDGVFTAGTDFSTSVAWAAEALHLPGIPYRVALNATDKEKMRTVFKEYNVPSPEFITLTPEIDAESVLEQLTFPLVVKPVDNMGARGVSKVTTCAQLKHALEQGFFYSRSERVIVEQYVAGPEFSVDALVYNGRITICGVADRIICFPPYFIEMGHTMPTGFNAQTVKSLIRVFKKGIRALGITSGAAKGDIILSKTGPVIGEIAARLSGGYMSGWTYPYASGVDVTKAALLIAVGSDPGTLRTQNNETSAERAFISIPGIVDKISGVEAAARINGIMDVFVRKKVGDKVCFPRNNVEKCGNVISKHADRKTAVAVALQAIQTIFIGLRPGVEETEQFLFNHAYPSLSCFTLTHKKNVQALHSMHTLWNASNKLCAENCVILKLPLLHLENTSGWHGMTILTALHAVLKSTGVHLTDHVSDNKVVLGSLFWKAFFKGGVQGGVYIIETLFKAEVRRLVALYKKRGYWI